MYGTPITIKPSKTDFDAMKQVTLIVKKPGASGGSTSSELKINSFTNNVNTAEIGSTVNSVILSWTLSEEAASVSIDGESQSTGTSGSKSYTNLGLTHDQHKTWILRVTGKNSSVIEKTTTISFLNGVYYGTSTEPAIVNSAFILGLTKELRSSKRTSIDVTADAGEYVYYCVPTRFGTCRFSVDGFTGGFALVDTISFTNASGYAEDYYVYRSDYAGLGAISVTIA